MRESRSTVRRVRTIRRVGTIRNVRTIRRVADDAPAPIVLACVLALAALLAASEPTLAQRTVTHPSGGTIPYGVPGGIPVGVPLEGLERIAADMSDWADGVWRSLQSKWVVYQILAVLASALLAALLTRTVSRWIKRLPEGGLLGRVVEWRRPILERVAPILFLIGLWIALGVMREITWPSNSYYLGLVAKLTTAWIVINALALVIRNRFAHRLVALGAWTLAALSILGLLDDVSAWMAGVGFAVGEVRLSLLLVVEAVVLLIAFVWLAGLLSRLLERALKASGSLSASMQVLLSKLLRIGLYAIAAVFALNAVGVDLTAFAVFSGAIGLGIGFGLQKAVSNFVSGITVLLDKSIKPGDVISLGSTFGWITSLNGRYVSVVTRDGREHLIPNEDLVTREVVNWSYTDQKVRVEVKFGTSYESDPHEVKRVVEEKLKGIKRVLPAPAPIVHFSGMGDSSLDFTCRFWIVDPVGGLLNVRSAVNFAIWDALKEHGIEIPFPQRDLHVKGPVPVRIEDARDGLGLAAE